MTFGSGREFSLRGDSVKADPVHLTESVSVELAFGQPEFQIRENVLRDTLGREFEEAPRGRRGRRDPIRKAFTAQQARPWAVY